MIFSSFCHHSFSSFFPFSCLSHNVCKIYIQSSKNKAIKSHFDSTVDNLKIFTDWQNCSAFQQQSCRLKYKHKLSNELLKKKK